MTSNSNTAMINKGVSEAIGIVRNCVVIFGVASAVVLSLVTLKSLGDEKVTTFMWVRSGLLLACAPAFYVLAARAARGSRSALQRLQLVFTVLPIAIVVVDLIPGVCPVWYAAVQGGSVIPLLGAAVLTRREPLRSAFMAER